MRKKATITTSIIILAVLLTIVLVLTGCSKRSANQLRMGTGGSGGNYYSYGVNLNRYLTNEESDFSLEVQTTAGSAANLRLISQGYLDLAIVQSDTLVDAMNGTGVFADDSALEGYHSIKALYTESCQVIARADSDIETIDDLEGKNVSIGEEGSGVVSNAETILKAYGLTTADLTVSNLSFSNSAKALESGEIDAFFCTASAPTTSVVDLSQNVNIKVIPVEYSVVKRIIAENSAYVVSTIPAGTYKGQKTEVTTVGVSAILIGNDELDEGIENTIISVLQKNNQDIQDVSFGVAPTFEQERGIYTLSIDMYLTLAIAVGVLGLGTLLKKKFTILDRFCVPAPVIGGLVFAIISCILYSSGVVEFVFDETLKTVCMVVFFTSVGFQANLKVLKKGGVSLGIFLMLVVVLILFQNGISVGLSKVLRISPLVGLCTGSIPMVGGHGTAGAFGVVLEDLGLTGAKTLCTAAATFGLVAGSLMGGPLGRNLIIKKDLMKTAVDEDDSILVEDEKHHLRKVSMYAPAAYQLAVAMGIGTIASTLLSKTGMTFPVYIGAMIVAAIMRNVGEYTGKIDIHMGEIDDLGGICLSLFLGIAMITLKLWQLADLALPLIALLTAQTVFMFVFAKFVVFPIMGKDYDAAILSAGTCGFGMGATPNAMANMQALTDKFLPSVKAYLLVPIVGSMFADFLNSIIITFFINIV